MYNILIAQLIALFMYNVATRDEVLNLGLVNSKCLPDKFWLKSSKLKILYLIKPSKVTKGFFTVYFVSIISVLITLILYILFWVGVIDKFNDLIFKFLLYTPFVLFIINIIVENICNRVYEVKIKEEKKDQRDNNEE